MTCFLKRVKNHGNILYYGMLVRYSNTIKTEVELGFIKPEVAL